MLLNKHGYPIEDNKAIIEVNLNRIEDVFEPKDPSPLKQRDLESSLEEYILSSVEEIGESRTGQLKFYFRDENQNLDNVESSVRNFFNYRADMAQKKIQRILEIGVKSLVIGLVALITSLFVARYFEKSQEEFLPKVLSEGAILFGWVSMWKPINIFMYEWWPIYEEYRRLRFLAQVKISVIQL